jgi:hypothetical protein
MTPVSRVRFIARRAKGLFQRATVAHAGTFATGTCTAIKICRFIAVGP